MYKSLAHLRTATIIALSFASVILIGSFILSLPISQISSSQANYIDHLFISVSATCVTGLYTESIADTYNLFGKTIILTMIQIGGLGLMTFFALVLRLAHRKMAYRHKQAMTSAINYDSIGGSDHFVKKIILYTLIIEAVGTLLLCLHFIPERGLLKGLGTSIFLSISAFCNAGFDPFSNISLINYKDNILINLTIAGLIILGGIGFGVWFDLTDGLKKLRARSSNHDLSLKFFWKKLRPHTRLAITLSFNLILLGSLFILITEWNNPHTFGSDPWYSKILQAFFQSVTMRTAGFATMDYGHANGVSLLIWSGLMLIGGSPGGAAGGIKTTTFAILILFLWQTVRNQDYVHYNHHTISWTSIRQAMAVGMLYACLFGLACLALEIFDGQVDFIKIIFEVSSALATVGVSASLTPSLRLPSLIVLMLLMFAGRIGPLTLLSALNKQGKKKNTDLHYGQTHILIG